MTDKTWEWFGQRHQVRATVRPAAGGYEVAAAIPWRLLGVAPVRNLVIQVTPAIKNAGHGKREWNWQPTGDRVRLGRLTLE